MFEGPCGNNGMRVNRREESRAAHEPRLRETEGEFPVDHSAVGIPFYILFDNFPGLHVCWQYSWGYYNSEAVSKNKPKDSSPAGEI